MEERYYFPPVCPVDRYQVSTMRTVRNLFSFLKMTKKVNLNGRAEPHFHICIPGGDDILIILFSQKRRKVLVEKRETKSTMKTAFHSFHSPFFWRNSVVMLSYHVDMFSPPTFSHFLFYLLTQRPLHQLLLLLLRLIVV